MRTLLGWLRNSGFRSPLFRAFSVPFFIQLILTVSIVWYISYYYATWAIHDTTGRLRASLATEVSTHLRGFLAIPHMVNANNVSALEVGLLDLDNPANREPFFYNQVRSFPTILYSFVGRPTGEFYGARRLPSGEVQIVKSNWETNQDSRNFSATESGRILELRQVYPDFDPRKRPWYQAGTLAKEPTWTAPYRHFVISDLALTASQPVYDPDGNLVAVFGVDYVLASLNGFLETLEVGQNGEVFIVERSGFLVASSSNVPSFYERDGQFVRYQGVEVENSLIQHAIEGTLEQYGTLDDLSAESDLEFTSQGRAVLANIHSFKDYNLDWLIYVAEPRDDVMGTIMAGSRLAWLISLFALVISLIIGGLTARWVIRPIVTLRNAAQGLREGDWNQFVDSARRDEIGDLARAFLSMADQLKDLINSLEHMVVDRTKEIQSLYSRLSREVDKARVVHEHTLPDVLPKTENVTFAAFYKPAEFLGGDTYNVIQFPGKIVFYVVDVTGHGLDGAIVSGFAQHTMNSFLASAGQDAPGPASVLQFLDRQFRREKFTDDFFICALVGVLDLETLVLSYSSAGYQNAPLMVKMDGEVSEIPCGGLPISGAVELRHYEFKEHQIELDLDTIILFSTDGLVEQRTINGLSGHYGQQLPSVLQGMGILPAEVVVRLIYQDLLNVTDSSTRDDDVTMLVLQTHYPSIVSGNWDVSTKLELLPTIYDEVSDLVVPYLADSDAFQMAIREMVANAVEHGNRFDPEKRVTLTIDVTAHYLHAVVMDEGDGFNWRGALKKPLDCESMEERGRGIAMAREGIDYMIYNESGTTVYLVASRHG